MNRLKPTRLTRLRQTVGYGAKKGGKAIVSPELADPNDYLVTDKEEKIVTDKNKNIILSKE